MDAYDDGGDNRRLNGMRDDGGRYLRIGVEDRQRRGRCLWNVHGPVTRRERPNRRGESSFGLPEERQQQRDRSQ